MESRRRPAYNSGMNASRTLSFAFAAVLSAQSFGPVAHAQVAEIPARAAHPGLAAGAFTGASAAAALGGPSLQSTSLGGAESFALTASLALASAQLSPTQLGAPTIAAAPLRTLPGVETQSLSIGRSAALSASPAARTQPGGIASAGAETSRISGMVSAALSAAGSIPGASAAGAWTLGGSLQRFLNGERGDDAPPPAGDDGGKGQPLDQELMQRALTQVYEVFTGHYAPEEFKLKERGVDFRKEYRKAKRRVKKIPASLSPVDKLHAFQSVLADFVASAQDYHATIVFYSSEQATLPFMALGTGDAYVIAYVDRTAPGMAEADFPFQPGDEIVEFDGKRTADTVKALTRAPNMAATDDYLGSVRLTSRPRRLGFDVPQGDLRLKIKMRDGKTHEKTLTWNYTPELPRAPVLHGRSTLVGVNTGGDSSFGGPIADAAVDLKPADPALARARQLLRQFVPLTWAHPNLPLFQEQAQLASDNGHMLSAKNSFVKMPGEVVFELPPEAAEKLPFVVRVHQTADGKKLGYLRMPDYLAGGDARAASKILEAVIKEFEKNTDALVIDQVNNGGGNMFFMNELASMLVDKPVPTLKHRVILEGGDAELARMILKEAGNAVMKDAFEKAMLELFSGRGSKAAPGVAGLIEYAKQIVEEITAGRQPSNPLHLFGVKEVTPHASARYTKPVLLLVNPANFSAADFFADLMKRSGRARILGIGPKMADGKIRTGGAGGAVKETSFLSQFYLKTIAYTWTIAVGPGLENRAVEADAEYYWTAQDFRDGFLGLADRISAWASGKDAVPQG